MPAPADQPQAHRCPAPHPSPREAVTLAGALRRRAAARDLRGWGGPCAQEVRDAVLQLRAALPGEWARGGGDGGSRGKVGRGGGGGSGSGGSGGGGGGTRGIAGPGGEAGFAPAGAGGAGGAGGGAGQWSEWEAQLQAGRALQAAGAPAPGGGSGAPGIGGGAPAAVAGAVGQDALVPAGFPLRQTLGAAAAGGGSVGVGVALAGMHLRDVGALEEALGAVRCPARRARACGAAAVTRAASIVRRCRRSPSARSAARRSCARAPHRCSCARPARPARRASRRGPCS